MIGSVRADWPAPFSVTIGNPRADKLGRNGFECIGRRCLVDRERCVRATFMHSAIENYSMLHLFNSIQFNSIKFISTFIHHYMSIIIIIHCIFLNEKSKRICRKLNKLITDIPGITHNQFT